MFIDYVPLMLINMGAGLFLLACCLKKSFDSLIEKRWAAGFLMPGAVALICGLHMIFTWPLPGSYNVAFGEMSVLLGILFLGAGLSVGMQWNLGPVLIYGFFAGVGACVVGIRFINLGLTREPLLSGLGFILTGLSGVILPVLYLGRSKILRWLIIIFLVSASIIWLRTGYKAYWGHLSDLSRWAPLTIKNGK